MHASAGMRNNEMVAVEAIRQMKREGFHRRAESLVRKYAPRLKIIPKCSQNDIKIISK
jgi:hypothetical protein